MFSLTLDNSDWCVSHQSGSPTATPAWHRTWADKASRQHLTEQAKQGHICLQPAVWLKLWMDGTLKENYEVREKREEGGAAFTLLWSVNTLLSILILLSIKFCACIYREATKDPHFKTSPEIWTCFGSEGPGFCFEMWPNKETQVPLCWSVLQSAKDARLMGLEIKHKRNPHPVIMVWALSRD